MKVILFQLQPVALVSCEKKLSPNIVAIVVVMKLVKPCRLGWEWMGSPVQMPKSEGLQLRKHKARFVGFQCCKF